MIHFFCAYRAEAQPIKDYFAINDTVETSLFPIFKDPQRKYSLTLTGAGPINAAAAAAYHYSKLAPEQSDIWFNIGIAGHKEVPLGRCVLVNKVIQHNVACWYPQILFATDIPKQACVTLDKPSAHYQNALFDMELAGLYAIWMRFAMSELCHSLKIIADNSDQNFTLFDKKKCSSLIKNHIPSLNTVLDSLHKIQNDYSNTIALPLHYHHCIHALHFSQTQQNQLKKLLYRWHSFHDKEPLFALLAQAKTSNDFLVDMESKLSDCVGMGT